MEKIKSWWESLIKKGELHRIEEVWKLISNIAQNILENNWVSDELTDKIILAIEESKKISYDSLVWIKQNQRNFDIQISPQWNKISIILVHKTTKQEFDLSSLFPNSWYALIPSDVDCYFNSSFTVWVNLNNMELRWFLLWILHEIGHSHQKVSSKPAMFLKMWLVAFAYSKLWIFIQKQLAKRKNYIDEDVVLEWEKQSRKERNAWAYALVQARKIEKMWFNIFDGFASNQEIFDEIWWHLSTYDECLFYDMLDAFWEITPENIHDFSEWLWERPLFNKKTRNLYQIHIPTWTN